MIVQEGAENLSAVLFEMVEEVIQAPDQRFALKILLSHLIRIFQMDQASFCVESASGAMEAELAITSTGRIIQDQRELWLSQTLTIEALNLMTPTVHSESQNRSDLVSKSVSEHSLRNVVCVPIAKNPNRVIFLASRRDPFRKYSAQELTYLKTAAHAAFMALQQNQKVAELKQGNERLEKALQNQSGRFLTCSPLMDSLIEVVARIAPFNVSVLIQGESGSGKEELAREIHRLSGRKGQFIAINCANLTESLLESELFGYVKGAFTGATTTKHGLFQEANGGTFFLDEIAELPLALQAKLLRVLQERAVRPLGGTADIPIDVRILAASHRELKQAVANKLFREDLYYRIQEMTVEIPALRERPEDTELLAHHFIAQFVAEFRLPERILGEEAVEKLLKHSWPGNVRELKNCCRTSVILAATHEIQASELRISPVTLPQEEPSAQSVPLTPQGPPQPAGAVSGLMAGAADDSNYDDLRQIDVSTDLKELTQRFERAIALEMLDRQNENQITVAKRLGISTRTLQRIIGRDPVLKSAVDASPLS